MASKSAGGRLSMTTVPSLIKEDDNPELMMRLELSGELSDVSVREKEEKVEIFTISSKYKLKLPLLMSMVNAITTGPSESGTTELAGTTCSVRLV